MHMHQHLKYLNAYLIPTFASILMHRIVNCLVFDGRLDGVGYVLKVGMIISIVPMKKLVLLLCYSITLLKLVLLL